MFCVLAGVMPPISLELDLEMLISKDFSICRSWPFGDGWLLAIISQSKVLPSESAIYSIRKQFQLFWEAVVSNSGLGYAL